MESSIQVKGRFRAINQPEKTKLENVLEDMERTVTRYRYSKDPSTKILVEKISDWRSELKD